MTAQAQHLEETGQLVQMSLKELSEQKTSVRKIESVPQYNKIDHHTGRTPMERFAINAEARIDDALTFTDKVKEKFAKLLEYFGEDGNMASNDFFGTMNRFLGDFAKAVDTVNQEDKVKVRTYLYLAVFWQLTRSSPTSYLSFHTWSNSKRKKQSELKQ